jgi:hypothetical protein
MFLRDDLGPVPRTLYILLGFLLAVAAIANDYHDWPLVQAYKMSPVGFTLINVIAIPLSLLIIVWGAIGRHREWRIGEDHIRIRLLSLTSWQKIRHLQPQEIESLRLDTFDHDLENARTAYRLTITCTDGKQVQSPQTYDPAVISQAKAYIERLKARA